MDTNRKWNPPPFPKSVGWESTLHDDTCEFDWTMRSGSRVPTHLHKDSDEHFRVLEGEITFTVDGKTILGKPGDELLVARMTPHAVRNKSGGVVKCRVWYRPVADQGRFFQILHFLSAQDPSDKNALFKAMYIADHLNYREFSTVQGGMKVAEALMLGFFKLFAPLLGWNKLVRRYAR